MKQISSPYLTEVLQPQYPHFADGENTGRHLQSFVSSRVAANLLNECFQLFTLLRTEAVASPSKNFPTPAGGSRGNPIAASACSCEETLQDAAKCTTSVVQFRQNRR